MKTNRKLLENEGQLMENGGTLIANQKQKRSLKNKKNLSKNLHPWETADQHNEPFLSMRLIGGKQQLSDLRVELLQEDGDLVQVEEEV